MTTNLQYLTRGVVVKPVDLQYLTRGVVIKRADLQYLTRGGGCTTMEGGTKKQGEIALMKHETKAHTATVGRNTGLTLG